MKKQKQFTFYAQLGLGLGSAMLITLVCYQLRASIDYRVTAMIFLSMVSLFAVIFDILPVLLTCLSSALLLNYFFIPPVNTLHISGTNDILLFFIFLAVALVNSILTYKIRITQKQARLKEDREKEIKLYNTLFNSLSHELRTPLATIIASTDNLLQEENPLNEENKRTLTEQIALAGKRLNEQVENLLNMSRMETGMLLPKAEWFDLNDLILESIQAIDNPQLHHFKLEENTQLPLVFTDVGMLHEILKNIFQNAVRYTPAGTTILSQTKLIDDTTLQISISDNGHGVKEEQLNKLFEKFYRAEQHAKGGSGLGLSIVKGYVEALNGSIVATKNSLGGLTFVIQLPVQTSYLNKLNLE